MTYDACLEVFRDECREHLPWEEAQSYLGLLDSRNTWRIYSEMESLKSQGRLPSPRFEKALDTFYWTYVA